MLKNKKGVYSVFGVKYAKAPGLKCNFFESLKSVEMSKVFSSHFCVKRWFQQNLMLKFPKRADSITEKLNHRKWVPELAANLAGDQS